MIVIVSGLAGSGKTTLAKRLANRYNLRFLTGSDFFRDVLKKFGIKLEENWHDTESILKLAKIRFENPEIDKEVDRLLIKSVEKGSVAVTSRTLPYLIDGIKIFLRVSQDERIRRVVARTGLSIENARKIVTKRDYYETEIYKRVYGVDVSKDLDVYNLIIDGDDKTEEEVEDEARRYIESVKGKLW